MRTGLFSDRELALFAAERWQKDAVELAASLPPALHALLTRVDDLLFRASARPDDAVLFVRNGGRLPPAKMRTAGHLDPCRIAAAIRGGCSLVFNDLQDHEPEVSRLCSALSAEMREAGLILDRRIGANLYVTGPEARCLPVHWDVHDVLVLQIAGTKQWTIHARAVDNPRSETPRCFANDFDEPATLRTTLIPGRCLYMPAGSPHSAATTSDPSVHLTLSLYPLLYEDLLACAIEGRTTSRPAVPAGSVDPEEAASVVRSVAGATSVSDVERALHRIVGRSIQEELRAPGAMIAQTLGLDDDRRPIMSYARQDATTTRLERLPQGGGLVFSFGEGEVTADVDLLPLFEFIHTHERFDVSELPPPPDDAEDWSDLLQNLVAAGLLRPTGFLPLHAAAHPRRAGGR